MQINQNTIVLSPANGIYDEFVLDPSETGNVLGGAFVTMKQMYKKDASGNVIYTKIGTDNKPIYYVAITSGGATTYKYCDADGNLLGTSTTTNPQGTQVPEKQADGIETAVVTGQVDASKIDDCIYYVVIENALLGKTFNHKAFNGEVTLLYRPVSGDRFLARCVPGNYSDGDPLYFVKTANGIYVTNNKNYSAGNTGTVVKAYAAESYVVSGTTNNTNLTPPFFYDQVDDSTTERPSSVPMNGGVMNLLRIRVA